MEILKAIDLVLQNAIVRWLLLIATVSMLVITGFSVSRQKILSMQLDAARGQAATYQAHLQVQNEAIIKANKDYDQQLKRTQEAKGRADIIAAELKRRLEDIRNTPLTGSCDEMVNQVIQEVRK